MHRTQYDRGMLDLRLTLIKMRTDYLNQINTQSTLLASCAVAMLGSSELIAMSDTERGASSRFLEVMFILGACVCLCSSLWVIYTAMNLINLSIHSTLYGESMRALTEADNIIESRMREVRLVFITSLGGLISAVMSIMLAESQLWMALMGASTFAFTGWHAAKSDEGTIELYQRYTGLTVRDRWNNGFDDLIDLFIPYGSRWHSSARKYQELRDRADPVIESFLQANKQDTRELEIGPLALRRALRRNNPLAGVRSKSTRPRGQTRDRGALEGELPAREMSTFSRFSAQVQDGSARIIQRIYRRHDTDKNSKSVHAGWLCKTASGGGPLERLRAAWAASDEEGGGPPSAGGVLQLSPPTPSFERWFVLDRRKACLAIYTSKEDQTQGFAPKGVVRKLPKFAVVEVRGGDGLLSLALLPRAALDGKRPTPPASAPVGGAPVPAPSSSPASVASVDGKSWYLRGKSEEQTEEWMRWLSEAGCQHVEVPLLPRAAEDEPPATPASVGSTSKRVARFKLGSSPALRA
jgi:hypothetical protein